MTETPAQRIAQLESLVNELTARVAADPANVDLPPLLAAAKAELADLQNPPAAPAAVPAPAAPAPVAPAPRPKIVVPAALKAPAPAAKSAGLKPMPPTVPEVMKARRPAPAAPRSAPVNPALTKAPTK